MLEGSEVGCCFLQFLSGISDLFGKLSMLLFVISELIVLFAADHNIVGLLSHLIINTRIIINILRGMAKLNMVID